MFLDDDDDCIPSNLLPPRKCCRLTPDQKIVLFFYLGMTPKIESLIKNAPLVNYGSGGVPADEAG